MTCYQSAAADQNQNTASEEGRVPVQESFWSIKLGH
jgi:hypothetical protein